MGIRNRARTKLEGAIRWTVVHSVSGLLPLYIVNEYPKSGGTWLAQMLATALAIPFPRNRIPKLQRSVIHGHYINTFGMRNVTVQWRDGRDVMVSWYHHCMFPNDISNKPLVDIVRRDFPVEDPADIERNLAPFIEYSFTKQQHPKFSWTDFVRVWHGRNNTIYSRYEDLRHDTETEIKRIIWELSGKHLSDSIVENIVNIHSFENTAKRKPGCEIKGSFLRKGIVGDWKNAFSTTASDVFDYYAGKELSLLGYKK